MDKETLSNYGWIVICVLVLAVMIALATPFGSFISDAVKSTTQGLFDVNQGALDAAGIEIMQQEFEEMLNDTPSDKTTVNVPGLGDVEVNDPNMELTYDPDSGMISGITPPADEPETPAEIPEENLPEIIEFTYGTFDTVSNYTPGTYETVPYEATILTPKYPVPYTKINFCCWLVDENQNIIKSLDATIDKLDKEYSTYVIYNANTGETRTLEGQTANSLMVYAISNGNNDTLANAVYLAAYLNKVEGTTNNHIATWNGTNYVAANYDANISAVDEFSTITTITQTRQVQITAPSTTTEYVYIPAGTLKAEAGMTWAEWLVSDYNTTGLSTPTIKTSDMKSVAYGDVIVAGASYEISAFSGATAAIGYQNPNLGNNNPATNAQQFCYLTINGTQYNSTTKGIELDNGDIIEIFFQAYGPQDYFHSSLVVNGETVATLSERNSTTYQIPVTSDTVFVGVKAWTASASTYAYVEVLTKDDIITFDINGTTQVARKGMTWHEWANSGCNTDGYENYSFYTMIDDTQYFVAENGVKVSSNSEIISGYSYSLIK